MTINLHRCFLPVFAIALMAGCAGVICGQDAQPSPAAAPRRVNLSLIVVDHSNQSVDDLQKEELRLFENNLPQSISSFSKADKAADYGIAIDTSGSVRPFFPTLLAAVRVFLENHKPDDECFIERFVSSDKIETLQEFTSDKATLLKPLSSLYIEGGQSAVIDAIYLAVQHVAQRPANSQRHRALILFSDGEDRASYYSMEQLLQLLRSTDIQIFVIGLVGELDAQQGLILQSTRQRSIDFLKTIARETGGRVFFPAKKKQISEALGEIFHDLHTQYEISYDSTDTSTDNFHPIRLEVVESTSRQKSTAITRPGYFLKPPALDVKEQKKKKSRKPS